jgi:hypothetical protein
MVDEWEENIHFKVLHSHVIDFSSSGPMSHSSCRSSFLDHYINRILSLFSDDFLQVFASTHAFTISQSAFCKA